MNEQEQQTVEHATVTDNLDPIDEVHTQLTCTKEKQTSKHEQFSPGPSGTSMTHREPGGDGEGGGVSFEQRCCLLDSQP